MHSDRIPDPNVIFPNEYKTSCYIKNVVTAPNIFIGDYTYYDDTHAPEDFETNNVLFNYPEFGDKLVIGKFCAIASGTKFIMGPANHRINSFTTYPFHVFGGLWQENTPPHLSQLPHKGDIRIGNDVWLGRECTVMPGAEIGDGSIAAACSVITGKFPPYRPDRRKPVPAHPKALQRRADPLSAPPEMVGSASGGAFGNSPPALRSGSGKSRGGTAKKIPPLKARPMLPAYRNTQKRTACR